MPWVGPASRKDLVPPSGGSLEIGNLNHFNSVDPVWDVPPSGGSLEIGNGIVLHDRVNSNHKFPLRGDP